MIKKGHFVKFLPPPQVADTVAPTGSICINNNSAYTNSSTVTLHLAATDNIGVTGYYISSNPTQPSAIASDWKSAPSSKNYSENISHTLDSGDGSKTIYVWYKDAAGNISSPASDSIILDTTAPTITITSPTSGDTFKTTISIVEIGGSASDRSSGVSGVWWSNSKGESWSVNGTKSWYAKIELVAGKNFLTVTAKDGAGNTSTYTIAVTYETSNIPSIPRNPPIPTASSFSVINYLMTGISQDEFHGKYSGCVTPPQKDSFLDTDLCAAQWYYYENATVGDTFKWEWYSPDGYLHWTDSDTFIHSEGCFSSYLPLKGYSASSKPGKWLVRVYRNGQFLFPETFLSKNNLLK